jgi:outer membrane protein assembly factor BamB
MRIALSILLIICSAAAADRPEAASYWSRFRGPNGTGISNDKHVAVQWTETKGVLWKTAIVGLGNSSPVVWGNRIFLQSATEYGKERLLLCVDTASGKIVWSRTVSGSAAPINPRNTLASSTPATDGKRVYALFWNGSALLLHSYDFSGKLVWKRELGAYASQHGAGASPIVYKNKVIVANDQDASSRLMAFDTETGQVAWEVPRPRAVSGTCYSTPFLLEDTGKPSEMIVASTPGLSAYDPETGRECWSWSWPFPGKPLRTVASPVYGRGFIFATSGDGGGDRHMIAVQRIGSGHGAKISLAWESNRLPYVPTMLTWGEHLYWVNDRGVAGCNVARTGETVWTERVGGNVTASPVLIDGKIYAANEDGDVHVFLAEPKFKLLAKNPIGELVRSTPAVADNRLFIRGQKHLICIGAAAGK